MVMLVVHDGVQGRPLIRPQMPPYFACCIANKASHLEPADLVNFFVMLLLVSGNQTTVRIKMQIYLFASDMSDSDMSES